MKDYQVAEIPNSEAMDIAIKNAKDAIDKSYLADLSDECDILELNANLKEKDITQFTQFYRIDKITFNKKESIVDKITTIYTAAYTLGLTVAIIIKSDENGVKYYIGAIDKKSEEVTQVGKALCDAFSGNLPGSKLLPLPEEEVRDILRDIGNKNGSVSAISTIPAEKNDEKNTVESYAQGIENMLDALQGKTYTAVIIADPISQFEIDEMQSGFEDIYTQIMPFSKITQTLSESETLGLTKTASESIAEGINSSIGRTNTISDTTGWNRSESLSKSRSRSISHTSGLSAIVINDSNSTSFSSSKTESSSQGVSGGHTDSSGETVTEGQNKTETTGRSTSDSKSTQTGKSIQIVIENKNITNLMQKLDSNLKRMDECRAFGAFNCAAYILSPYAETNNIVCSNYNAVIRGGESLVQPSYVNLWKEPDDVKELCAYLSKLTHPTFVSKQDKDESFLLSASTVITSKELAIQAGLPKRSVHGIDVVESASFGRNTVDTFEHSIVLGNLYNMGKKEENTKIKLDIDSLSMHTFITGSTGAGKSTAVYSIIDKIMTSKVKNGSEKIKFMVIEPAKGEYKDRFGGSKGISVYGTNFKKMPLLKINPFSFPDDIHVLEHIERLIEIFNVCWPMYAAMPAVLKESVERAYKQAGWNLKTSECAYKTDACKSLYPTFSDVLSMVNTVMEESQYSNDSKGDYKGALCTRLKSLTNGLYRDIFTCNEIDAEKLFNENVIVDLSRIGSGETKALLMGLLVMKLQEFRMSENKGSNSPLRHVTILEEAHNLLKRTSTEQSAESSNLAGKSVEMLANAIAEMRTYGEGFIIVDQAPGLMDMSVIRNTNTKIIFRLPDQSDRELVGKAANLNDDQINELARLETFVAAVYQNNWLEPVLCSIETNFTDNEPYSYTLKKQAESDVYDYIRFLITPPAEREKIDRDKLNELKENIYYMPFTTESKLAFLNYIEADNKEEVQNFRRKALYGIFNSKESFGVSDSMSANIEIWYRTMLENLEPAVDCFDETDCKKIVNELIQANILTEQNKKAEELFYKWGALLKRRVVYND